MNDLVIFGALMLALWLLRNKSNPLKIVVYDSDGNLAWESWTDTVSEPPKLLFVNSADHIVEAILDNNSQNAITIDLRTIDNQNVEIRGIPAGIMERILVPVGNSLYGQSYAKSNLDIMIVYNSELILK